MREIKDLHPRLQSLADELLTECKRENLKIKIGECLRTVKEQDALYAQGRTTSGSIVTNAKGSSYSSMHQWGVAFDFFRNDGKSIYENSDGFFDKVGKIGKKLGLFWGGDFKSIKDLPHFQLPDWGTTPSRLKALYKKPEEFFKTWEDDAMTISEKNEFDKLKAVINVVGTEIQQLKNAQEKVYNSVSEVPSWGKATVSKLIEKGFLTGSENGLNMPETLLRVLVINDRAGLYK